MTKTYQVLLLAGLATILSGGPATASPEAGGAAKKLGTPPSR